MEKENFSLIHFNHYIKVKEEDKKAYTSLIEKGVLIVGLGIMLAGVIGYFTQDFYEWLCLSLYFVAGFIFIFKAQKNLTAGFLNFCYKRYT